MAEPIELTDKQIMFLLEELERHTAIEQMDNRKLLWCLMQTEVSKQINHMPLSCVTVALFSELERRLYPEYDGDSVTFRDWGWKTPEGEVRYIGDNLNQV